MRLTWAWRQWAFRPGLAVMNVVLLAVGLALLSCLMQARDQWQAQLSRDLVGTDMVIGPKGSPLQLVLAGVYHLDTAQGTVPLASLRPWGHHPLVADWLPLALGDQAQGFRIVGTVASAQDWYGLKLRQGVWSTQPMAVVLGAEVARQTGWSVGHAFHAQHGLSGGGDAHDQAYQVVGIAEPAGHVADRLIFTPLASVALVHGLSTGGAGHGGAGPDHAPHEARWQVDAAASASGMVPAPQGALASPGQGAAASGPGPGAEPGLPDMPVSLALFRFRSPLAAAMLPPQVQREPGLQSARPSLELARLQAVTGAGEAMLQGIAALMLVMALLASSVGVQTVVMQRLPDLAMWRMLGASWPRIVSGLALELAWSVVLAWLLACLLSRLGVWWLSSMWMPSLRVGWGAGAMGAVSWPDALTLLAALGLGALSLMPAAWRLRRMDVMQVLGRRG